MLTRRTVILVAAETTYGTDPAIAGFSPLLAWDVNPDIKGEVLERNILRDTLTQMGNKIGMKEVGITFKTEVKGALNSTSAPEWGDLMRGCGFVSSSTAAITQTAFTFTPVSSDTGVTSLSILAYMDGNLHKITGCRGSFKAILEAGKYGIFDWDFKGLYNPVSAATIPDISTASTVKPPIVYAAAFQIGGFSPVCSKCEIDRENDVTRRDDLNATYGVRDFRISDRKGKLSFDADAVVESSNPFWGDWAGEVIDTYAICVGTGTLGNQIKFSGYFQYKQNKYADKDGIRTYECEAELVSSSPNTQNDELIIYAQ
jgi:hypothetical protein